MKPNFDANRHQFELIKIFYPLDITELNNLYESLILAQDERWRRV